MSYSNKLAQHEAYNQAKPARHCDPSSEAKTAPITWNQTIRGSFHCD
jgi:hypothetical protein